MATTRRRSYRKLLRDPLLLCSAVIEQLKEGWSPEQIAGRLRISDGPARLCHETIYQYVYSSEGHDKQLARHLPERCRKRRREALSFQVVSLFATGLTLSISGSIFGHWEAYLMIFRKELGSANVATVIERKGRVTILFRNNDRRSKHIMNQLIRHLAPCPRKLGRA